MPQPARKRGAGPSHVAIALASVLPAQAALAAPEGASPQTVSPPSQPLPAIPGRVAKPGQALAITYPALSSDDELIVEISTEHHEMTDTITAHGLRGGVYLPFGDLARFLDLPIQISDDGHYASGWFLSPTRTVAINLRAGTIMLSGRERPLRKTDFAAFEGELYIKAEALAEILPISASADLRALSVTVKTREPFPFQDRLQREAAREKLANTAGRDHQTTYPRQQTPWKAIDAPITDVEVRAQGGQGRGTHLETDLRASGDLAFMTAHLYAGFSSSDALTGARLELGRRDPDAGLLGGLHATDFEMGDVASSSQPVGLRGVAGRGITLTNEPLEHASAFETIDFRGDLPTGYEVELYRNDVLIGSTRNAVNSQYEFIKVPVEFGQNVFRLVFYGPEGQRREEVRRINVGDGRLARGAFVYNLSAVQKDTPLFGLQAPGYLPSIDQGAWRGSLEMQYGLTGGITTVAGAALYQGNGTTRWFGSAGLRTGIGRFAAKVDGVMGNGGGRAVELGLAGRVLGTSLVATHARYGGGFIDEVRSPDNKPLSSMTSFNLANTLHLGSKSVPLSLDVQHLAYVSGQVSDTATFRQSFTTGRMVMSNAVVHTIQAAPGMVTTRMTSGTFDLSSYAGSHTEYRAGVGYDIGPKPRISTLSGEVDHTFNSGTSIRTAITHSFADNKTTLGLSGGRKFGPFALSFDSTYTVPTRQFAFTLRLGFSFGRNPLNGRMFTARPGLSNGGAVALRAYSDTNGNGRYDKGEPQVGKATFFTPTQTVTADDSGTAILGGTSDGSHTAVRIDGATLPDIAMAPARPGVEIVSRAGRIPVVEFAIDQLSDVEGTAVFLDHGGKRAVAGVTLYLVDGKGHRVARARSENDGFLLFEQIRPGTYDMIIDANQARNLKIRLHKAIRLTIGRTGKLVRTRVEVVRD